MAIAASTACLKNIFFVPPRDPKKNGATVAKYSLAKFSLVCITKSPFHLFLVAKIVDLFQNVFPHPTPDEPDQLSKFKDPVLIGVNPAMIVAV